MRALPLIVFLLISLRPCVAQSDCQNTPPGKPLDPSGNGRQLVEVSPATSDGSEAPPIADATVTVTAPSGAKTTYTAGSDGCVGFPTHRGEDYRVEATAKGHGRSIQMIQVQDAPPGFGNGGPILALLPPPGLLSDMTDPNTGGAPVPDNGDGKAAPAGHTEPPGSANSQLVKALLDFLLSLLAPAAYFGLQEITIRTMAAGMMKKGAVTGAANAGRSAVEDVTPTTTYYPSLASIPDVPGIQIAEMDSSQPIHLSGLAAARLDRVRFTERRKFLLLLLSFVAQACGVGAITLVAWRANPDPFMLPTPGIVAAADLLVVWWAWTLYLAGKRVMELIAALASVGVSVLSIIAIAKGLPFYEALIPAVLQVALLWAGWRRMRRSARVDGNHKLVILRVFGSDKNTASVFGTLMSGWRFAGSFLTIADPSFLRYQFSVFSRANATKSLGVTLAIATFASVINHLAWILQQLPVHHMDWFINLPDKQRNSVVYAAISVLAVGPLVLYVRRRFLEVPAQAIEKVDAMREARLGVESDYPGSAFYCYDDVWKPAVSKMLDVADVILMDLRGFSAARQGCTYEIGLLLDRFPVNRLLFLIDKTTPKELLFGLIRQRWSVMDLDSPNRKVAQGLIKVFATGPRAARDNKQIEAILSASVDGRLVLEGGKMTYLAQPGRGGDLAGNLAAQSKKVAMQPF
jgi:hypothetical protein